VIIFYWLEIQNIKEVSQDDAEALQHKKRRLRYSSIEKFRDDFYLHFFYHHLV